MFNVNNFNSVQIGLASPEQIRNWSSGEVKKPETINYRTLKPEKEGLFCEKIFGPTKDWECHCGKYKRVRYKGVVCDRCGVEVTRSKVRRERMGHIELAAPVSHIWYFKGIPSRLGLIMDMSPRSLEKVLYFVNYIVIDPGDTTLTENQLLSESEYREARIKHGSDFKAGMGAEAIKEILRNMDLDQDVADLKAEIKEVSGQRRKRAVRRLKVLEGLRQSGNLPQWLILEVIPVIPPELRPMVQLDGGRFATSDLNDLYRRVINRNNRLKRLLDLGAPDIIIRNEKRMLQEAVDALIDNGRRGRPVTGAGNRPLKSLSDMLKGKQGRFRQNLLGKRVDYSGRSVIVVGPELKMHQCGLPKKMALELFKPFVMKKLVDEDLAHNIKSAKGKVEKLDEEVWDILEGVIKEHPVLLNRAPTLHRLGIQAFEPILVEGKAIKIHPLVCPAYNADFDGDQMAVHVPLSAEAQAESRLLMLSTYNILSPADGEAIAVPSQDMVLGAYYMTMAKEGVKGEGKIFGSTDEVLMAYENKVVDIQAKINYRLDGDWIETTVGRVLFNDILPDKIRFYNKTFDKGALADLVGECEEKFGPNQAADILDSLKDITFEYSTKAGVTIGVEDVKVPAEKKDILKQAEEKVEFIEEQHKRGMVTEKERYQRVIDIWGKAKDEVTEAMADNLSDTNSINMMATSGARGNTSQITQLGGMRGLMTDPSGQIIDLPIKANFREGLTVLEYFISTHGARKGLADTALRTADSGYLTRRLVDVSQDMIVREKDCGTEEGLLIGAIKEGREIIEPLEERIIGKLAAADLEHPENDELIVAKDEMIDEKTAAQIIELGIEKVNIRSVLTCKTKYGVCCKCYGRNLANGRLVNVGEAVGIIAAQSIGEPGTQLTMRTFHTGGVAGDDITQGLPRVEELFEARTPKGQAIVTELSGQVNLVEKTNSYKAVIKTDEGRQRTYQLPYGSELIVEDGEYVEAGTRLTKGPLDPEDILNIQGTRAVQKYLLREVQDVYRSQGVEINDKHIAIVIRQMMSKVKIKESGDTDLLPGDLVDVFEFREVNEEAIAAGKEPATAKPELLGITKASLNTKSFLSAASFQETTRVLTEASLEGKNDPLIGLKENVIIGQLIPAGTGMKRYRDIDIDLAKEEDEEDVHSNEAVESEVVS
ncbi:DNA-directed RNA polymerase subunit beta' [Fuchsiella alkaliacetigena]|uniref:DNA-directed RNA polymerase subunit beta' n=1 Tax=Fuchsiella alkaliacetigena TaxID=957042 RepID=UPI00200AD5BA|nr:DNA-directed RNA polymerase subunit beta' [Fuchsiella alkaliacetigena]MCK8825776.1 DNA-directed RNA polymerase subunit beta' [Fuchsiella alkaliacetigena]